MLYKNNIEYSLKKLESKTIVNQIIESGDELYEAKQILENIRHHNKSKAEQFNQVINKLPQLVQDILALRSLFPEDYQSKDKTIETGE